MNLSQVCRFSDAGQRAVNCRNYRLAMQIMTSPACHVWLRREYASQIVCFWRNRTLRLAIFRRPVTRHSGTLFEDTLGEENDRLRAEDEMRGRLSQRCLF